MHNPNGLCPFGVPQLPYEYVCIHILHNYVCCNFPWIFCYHSIDKCFNACKLFRLKAVFFLKKDNENKEKDK